MADGLSNGANSSAHARRELKFDSRAFLFAESNDKQRMPHLRHSKIIGIKLTVKYPKTGCVKQLSKVSQFTGVHLVTEPQNVFKNKKVQIERPVQLRKQPSIVFGQLGTRIICSFVAVAQREGLTWRNSNCPDWPGRSGQFQHALNKKLWGYLRQIFLDNRNGGIICVEGINRSRVSIHCQNWSETGSAEACI